MFTRKKIVLLGRGSIPYAVLVSSNNALALVVKEPRSPMSC
ncbi:MULTISPECIES: hypothetical protein [Flagellimonas]|uniref:Uncharacterized protein n=1 Tax=Flagellimonas okinawensis TaxID=3031324 RepID=A0ABT5XSG8_9FLAO|nr:MULTISPECIES: hypothetical protein [Allomuricauda]MDF0708820.1 hypothetical protein [[Muricauda] okinawensis]